MSQRLALTIAAAISAFLITLAGGVAAYMAVRSAPTTGSPEAVVGASAPEPWLDPNAEGTPVTQQDANQLNQAYEQQQLLVDNLRQMRQQPPAPVAQPGQAAIESQLSAPGYAVSPESAIAIALGGAPGAALNRAPELVRFQGVAAYEVLLDRGAVYVDANSGQILYDGATGAVASGGEREGHEGGEHDD
ncbi:MAG TPA: PepSY domain-containing protein [Roseiflexaceae bacterium]|nr:PepSY domain-containing protein [Roseiflexaceae bacterium]